MKPRTYTQAQYLTPEGRAMIRQWIGPNPADRDWECTLRFMTETLRIGGRRVCRAMIHEAMADGLEQAETDRLTHEAETLTECGPDGIRSRYAH